jgi:predicted permease
VYRDFDRDFGNGPGYRTDHLLLMTFDPSLVHYTPEKAKQFFRDVVDGALEVPGVKSAALTTTVPMSLSMLDMAGIVPEGFRAARGGEAEENVQVHFAARVDENYFSTMAMPITRGRAFRKTDDADAPLVAIVNQTLIDHYWPGEDGVGKRFRRDRHDGPWVEIVGVTPTTKYLLPIEGPMPYVYLPVRQDPAKQMTLIVESIGDAAALTAPLREMITRLDRNQPVYDVIPMERFYDAHAVSVGHLMVRIVGGMGLTGMLLSMVGLYGLVTYSANRRTREIGIRIAVGADPPSVLWMILRQGLWLASAGVLLGLVASRALESAFRAAFPGSPSTDLWVYPVVVTLLLAVTLLAAFVPARRASRVNPTVALRHD